MEFLAFVPVLFALPTVFYFAARLIVDYEIRSAEREFGQADEVSAGPGGQSPDASVVPGDSTVPVVASGDSAGRTRGGSGAIGGWAGLRRR